MVIKLDAGLNYLTHFSKTNPGIPKSMLDHFYYVDQANHYIMSIGCNLSIQKSTTMDAGNQRCRYTEILPMSSGYIFLIHNVYCICVHFCLYFVILITVVT